MSWRRNIAIMKLAGATLAGIACLPPRSDKEAEKKERIVTMKLNKLLRSVLKTAVYIMDQTADQVDRASSRAVEFADDAREVVYPSENHTLRNVASFAAGIGIGVGVGVLLAPSSGQELRDSISGKVQDFSNRVRGRAAFATSGEGV
jgi:hypothetical protein